MKLVILILCMVYFVGCAPMRQIDNTSVPQLLLKHPLPPIPESFSRLSFDLDVVLFILEDGSVSKGRLLKGSDDASWDSLAIASIKQWRFTPARTDNQPISTWFHLRTKVRYADLQIMNLAEILCTTSEEADSVYEALELGHDFGELAMRCSVDPSREMKGILGEVNINMYPEDIFKSIGKLAIDTYTKPMKYGDLYVVFKRLKK
jgi:parvulin-like peptidyl-prolyl isomerase